MLVFSTGPETLVWSKIIQLTIYVTNSVNRENSLKPNKSSVIWCRVGEALHQKICLSAAFVQKCSVGRELNWHWHNKQHSIVHFELSDFVSTCMSESANQTFLNNGPDVKGKNKNFSVNLQRLSVGFFMYIDVPFYCIVSVKNLYGIWAEYVSQPFVSRNMFDACLADNLE